MIVDHLGVARRRGACPLARPSADRGRGGRATEPSGSRFRGWAFWRSATRLSGLKQSRWPRVREPVAGFSTGQNGLTAGGL